MPFGEMSGYVPMLPDAAYLRWGPASSPPGVTPERLGTSAKMPVDATKRWASEPVSLPQAEYSQRARVRWSEYGI